MTHSIKLGRLLPALPFIIPVLCILVANSALFTEQPTQLSMAITFDLLITTPILYFLTIRKRTIPNTTVVPVFILGIVIASIILPADHQYYLSLVKTWFLPFLELAIITYIIISIRKAVKKFKENESSPDFFTAAKTAASEILPNRLSTAFATELSLFYFGFIHWKKTRPAANQFTYHQTTSTRLVLGVFVFVIIVEALVVHLLVQRWSTIVAWILTILSIYACFQVFGILRSLGKRMITVEDGKILLRYGIMNETAIQPNQIQQIEVSTASLEKEEGLVFLSPFKDMEGTNVIIDLKEEHELIGFYGFKKPFRKIALFVDDPERMVRDISYQINPSEQSSS